MNKPNLTDVKYRWTVVTNLAMLYLLFSYFDYRDNLEWVFWDFRRLSFLLGAYILYAFIQYRVDTYRYHRPEKYPTFESKYSNRPTQSIKQSGSLNPKMLRAVVL